MIIGAGVKNIGSTEINSECPGCGSEHTFHLVYAQQYFHIFWIPTFPIKKIYVAKCTSCTAEWVLNKTEAQKHLGETKVKTPFSCFIGAILLAIFIGYLTYDIEQDRKRYVEYIHAPQVGDIYKYKADTKEYSLLKVIGVTDDTISALHHEFVVDKIQGLTKLSSQDTYKDAFNTEDTLYISKARLIELKEENTIMSVIRK